MASENNLWVEKYRPDTLAGYIGNEKVKEKVEQFIEEKSIPHLLFHATPGSGKTTLGKIICNCLDSDVLYINASDENIVETIRSRVRNFASTAGFKGIKIIFLDEADYMTPQAQSILRHLMETFSKNTRFILTCNYLDKIMPALQSRCQSYNIVAPQPKEVMKKLITILKTEGVEFDPKDKEQLMIIKRIVDMNFPDIRKCIQLLQQNVIGGELMFDETTLVQNEYTKKVIEFFEAKPKYDQTTFEQLKQILADSQVKNFEPLFTDLFHAIEDIAHGKSAQVLTTIAEYQHKSHFAIDKEIPAMAMLISIVQLINSK